MRLGRTRENSRCAKHAGQGRICRVRSSGQAPSVVLILRTNWPSPAGSIRVLPPGSARKNSRQREEPSVGKALRALCRRTEAPADSCQEARGRLQCGGGRK